MKARFGVPYTECRSSSSECIRLDGASADLETEMPLRQTMPSEWKRATVRMHWVSGKDPWRWADS